MVGSVITKRTSYDKVIMPAFERLPIYYLYLSHNVNQNLAGKFKFGILLDTVDNVIFAGDWCPSKYYPAATLSKNTLVVDMGDCDDPRGFREIKRIIRSDSTRAYKFLVPEG